MNIATRLANLDFFSVGNGAPVWVPRFTDWIPTWSAPLGRTPGNILDSVYDTYHISVNTF